MHSHPHPSSSCGANSKPDMRVGEPPVLSTGSRRGRREALQRGGQTLAYLSRGDKDKTKTGQKLEIQGDQEEDYLSPVSTVTSFLFANKKHSGVWS